MFVRYLGGGIGHLEQFPPANNDDGVTYEYKYEEDNEGDNETGDIDKGEDDQDDKDEDGTASESDECLDPGESSDEDTGNVY